MSNSFQHDILVATYTFETLERCRSDSWGGGGFCFATHGWFSPSLLTSERLLPNSDLIQGAAEICVALSVCNLPVLIPAFAAREEREKFEGTRTGFSFGRETTVLSTLNTVHMHLEPDLEESFKSAKRREFMECKCSGNPSFPSSNGGGCCSACSSRKAYPL